MGTELVCIHIQPYGANQVPNRRHILNVGSVSDAVFSVVAAYQAIDHSKRDCRRG